MGNILSSVSSTNLLIGISVVVLSILLVKFFVNKLERETQSNQQKDKIESRVVDSKSEPANPSHSQKQNPKKKPIKQPMKMEPHPLQLFANNAFDVTTASFSPSGEFIAFTRQERTITIIGTEHFSKSTHKLTFLAADWATASVFTSDSHHLLMSLAYSREIVAYQVGYSKGQVKAIEAHRFQTHLPKDISSIDVTKSSKYIITSLPDDTHVYIWSLKGQLLHTLDTAQVIRQFECNRRFCSAFSS